VQRFDEKNMVFIVLSSIKTVHGTVKYRYCFFTAQSSLEDWAKMSESLTFIVRERKYTVNVQCSVQYALLLLYLMLIMSYCA